MLDMARERAEGNGEGDARRVWREMERDGDADGRGEDEGAGRWGLCAGVVMSSGEHRLFRPSEKGHRRERLQLDWSAFLI